MKINFSKRIVNYQEEYSFSVDFSFFFADFMPSFKIFFLFYRIFKTHTIKLIILLLSNKKFKQVRFF